MLMILKDSDSKKDVVLDINTEFITFIENENKTCVVGYFRGKNYEEISILGTIEEAVNTINRAIADVKRRYPEYVKTESVGRDRGIGPF